MVGDSNSHDGDYFNWLYGLIAPRSIKNPGRSYTLLAELMHNMQFEWTVPNDDNRLQDGLELRFEYLNDDSVFMYECTVLEMLIALARRCSFEDGTPEDIWFWHFMENLGLSGFNDEEWDEQVGEHAHNVVYSFVHRRYTRNGRGGLFPVDHARGDMRRIEIWYQMSTYILEGHGPS